ncbi:MAG: hypothetical protein QM757_26440 [Paludibaculum sp.]
MTPLAEAPAALDKQQLLSMMQASGRKIFTDHLDRTIEVDRFYQVTVALRNELFWRGKQHIALRFNEADGSASWDAAIPDLPGEKKPQVLAYHFNITRSDGQKFGSVVGNRAPHANVDPKVAEDTSMTPRVRQANAGIRYLNQVWGADALQKDASRILWKTGPAFFHSRWVADSDLYGKTAEPVMGTEEVQVTPDTYRCPQCLEESAEPQCPNCGISLGPETMTPGQTAPVPTVVDTKEYPNGQVKLDIYSILNVVISRSAKELKDTPYLRLELDGDRPKTFDLYREQLGERWLTSDTGHVDTTSGEAAAAQARQQLTTTDAVLRTDPSTLICRLVHDWLRPSLYHLFDGDALKQALFQQFPDGIHTVRVDDRFVDLLPCRIEDEWSVAKTGTDERILSDALCHDLVPMNQILNDFFNLALQTVLQGIPKTLVDSSLLTRDAAKRPIIGEVIPTKTAAGQDMNKMMATLPTARFSDQLMPLADSIRSMSREIDGVMEAIFGGGPTTNTWRESEQRKNQALAQLNGAFIELCKAWKQAYENGLRLLGKYGVDIVAVPNEELSMEVESDLLDMQGLDMDGLTVNVNEAIPMTMPEEREQLIYSLTNLAPEVVSALGLLHPASIPRVHQLLNLRGIYCPGEKERRRAMEIIRRLLKEQPLASFDPMTGAQMQVSSVQPDPVLDNHGLMFELIRAWCIDTVGMRMEQENPIGFANVRLYAQAQQQAQQQQQMAAQMAAGPAPAGPTQESEPQQPERMAA